MSGNSSSTNDSHLHPHFSSTNPSSPSYLHCLISIPSSFIFTSFCITYILLLLPLCSFILYHGLQHWWQKRSTSSVEKMSHSDSFTYHLVSMELIGVLGCFLCCCGIYMDDSKIVLVGCVLYSYTWYGETFFHILTCVERYLAVVHPITYLKLRRERGIRLRNITIGCVWLLCFAGMGVMNEDFFMVEHFFFLALSLTVVSFCSLSVLCVLIRPGPGEQGGSRERVDQTKQRAFYTIVAILGALLLRFASSMVWAALYGSVGKTECVMMTSELWFNLPSSLVLPLLFLHRTGKLVCCKNNNQRG